MPIRVGKVDPKHPNLTNTSCRLISVVQELKPGETIAHKFKLFAGPKKPAVLEALRSGRVDLLRLADLRRGRRAADA